MDKNQSEAEAYTKIHDDPIAAILHIRRIIYELQAKLRELDIRLNIVESDIRNRND